MLERAHEPIGYALQSGRLRGVSSQDTVYLQYEKNLRNSIRAVTISYLPEVGMVVQKNALFWLWYYYDIVNVLMYRRDTIVVLRDRSLVT